jgi:hypothetical protein
MAKADKTTTAVKVTLTKDRDTKGTYVYKTDDREAAIRSLYITKSAVGEAPDQITVTIDGMSAA